MKLIIIYLVCIALVQFVHGRDSRRQKCRRNDPNLEKCILGKITAIKQAINHEPFRIDQVSADASMNGARIKATITNIVAYRGSNFRIEHFKVNVQNKNRDTGEVKVVFPRLDVTADYHFSGTKMFFINFKTHGKFKGKFENVEVVFKYFVKPYTKYGLKYMKLNSVTSKISIANANLNLKQADRSWAGRQIALYAHSDPYGSLQKLTPAIEKNSAKLFEKYINGVLAKVPVKSVFED